MFFFSSSVQNQSIKQVQFLRLDKQQQRNRKIQRKPSIAMIVNNMLKGLASVMNTYFELS